MENILESSPIYRQKAAAAAPRKSAKALLIWTSLAALVAPASDADEVEELVGVRVAMLIVVLRGTDVPVAIMVPLLPPTAGAVPTGIGMWVAVPFMPMVMLAVALADEEAEFELSQEASRPWTVNGPK